ncbi:hypothetical protein SPRG_19791 [Saprolegnia parasitica CBS 223.65]|uniref:Uncharacterized protein n=1 Tax=Saprolegnia parasitica (strain CBS 223.65) TaxID=695850 RepID=A0A067CUQ0_SAPPC|nr:hypothetical protein SPRG_19791 [Saprolegnia parasitica CBS 223.65]KDO30236.1 hypothetical protein SPRG_19791 [Saprolegnia parasitica CBS 223.65]|eukprot:XP_012199044.1 hypothetical protein SPRG_19791 [Saprolegnia parasitica CBS 223.65]
MSACCDDGGDHHEHARGHVEGYDIEGDDPTLSACCLKDKQEQAYVARVMTVLRREDVTMQRLEQRHLSLDNALPRAAPAVALTSIDDDDDLDSDDDEYAYLMDDESIVGGLEHQRRAALLAKAALREQGLGIVWGDTEFKAYVRNVLARDTQALVTAKHLRPIVVARSDVATQPLVAAALLQGAERFLGTCFFGVSANADEAFRRLCPRVATGPMLLALSSSGEYIAHRSLAIFDEDDWDRTLLPWLEKCNVLRTDFVAPTSAKPTPPTKTSTNENDDDENDDDGPTGYDCGHDGCRLKFGYYHEHVGTSKETKQAMAAWRQ